jgi:subfamily B ATP-binding cassette protein MsbA
MNRYRRMFAYVLPYRLRLLATFACMALLAITTAIYAFMVGPLLAFLVTGDYRQALPGPVVRLLPGLSAEQIDRHRVLLALPVLMISVALIKGVAYAGQFYLMGTIGQLVVADLRKELFAKLLSMSPAFYARRHTADLYSRLTLEVSNIENAIIYSVSSYVRDSLQIGVLLLQAFILDWRLSLIAFGAIPLTVFPVARFAGRLKRVTSQSNQAMSKVTQVTQEAVSSIRVVQSFGMEERERRRFGEAVGEYLAIMRRSLRIRGTSTPTMEIIAVTGISAAIAFAGNAVTTGSIDPRAFMSFVATVMLMYQPAKSIGRVGHFLVQGLAAAERVFEILDTPNDIIERPGARDLPAIRNGIVFENVSFRYAPRTSDSSAVESASDEWVLRDLNLEIRKGEVVALVGRSGSGKTTIANLVPRFFDAVEGKVSIDGNDVRDVTLQSLRAQVSLVTQETLLFNESVGANISYGKPGASQGDIEAAAKAADAHEFIRGLPEGYATVIGEKGLTLSGGQKQRLAIARALLKDSPILVLDEATSALDTRSEAEVQRALERLMRDRTVLVIAHRLSTVRNANRIVVLIDGRIVESGSHAELLARRGEYARMWAAQAGEGAGSAEQKLAS